MYLSNTCDNDAVTFLESLSFNMLSTENKMEIEALFSSGLTLSQAYNKFLRILQSNSEDELKFHLKKTDQSKCPGRKTLIYCILNIPMRNLKVEMALKCSINLRKELIFYLILKILLKNSCTKDCLIF